MESLTLLRKHLEMSGISPPKPPQKHSFNAKNLFVLIVIVFSIILYTKQLYTTDILEEQAEIIYDIDSSYFWIAVFLSMISKTSALFKLIDDLDEIINESK